MREICRICGRIVRENRTSHLKEHGIEADFKGAIKQYFLTSEEHFGKIKEVSLLWLRESSHPLAKKFREVASRTPTNECPLCAMFFEDNGYSFDEIDETEIEHFQQIADSFGIPIKIVSLK